MSWTKQIRTDINSNQIKTFDQAMTLLKSSANTEDVENPCDEQQINIHHTQNNQRGGAKSTHAYDNRRISHDPFSKRYSKNSYPEHKKNGLVMLCRACCSDENFQSSGNCDVQKRRTREGIARTYMIQSIVGDIEPGMTPWKVLDEIFNSQMDEKSDETVAIIATDNDPIPEQEMNYDPYGFVQTLVVSTTDDDDLETIQDVLFEDLTEKEKLGIYTRIGETLPFDSDFLCESKQNEIYEINSSQGDTEKKEGQHGGPFSTLF